MATQLDSWSVAHEDLGLYGYGRLACYAFPLFRLKQARVSSVGRRRWRRPELSVVLWFLVFFWSLGVRV